MSLRTDSPAEIIASAPARLDLAGGWTDVPPYTTEVGGAVCNIAIELRAVATLTAVDGPPIAPNDALSAAAWQRAMRPPVAIRLHSAIPIGSGLGGSSAAGVALAAALAAWRGEHIAAGDLAELSRSTEVETLRLPGGCQDHYAAAYGGALLLHCDATTTAHPVVLSEAAIYEFETRALVAFTGESRMSSRTITAVIDAYRGNDRITCNSLSRMKLLSPLMAGALAVGDMDELGRLVADQWDAQRALHPTITTPLIDRIVHDVAKAGALGTKALGASGGGCVLVIARADRVHDVSAALSALAQLLPVRVARTGVQVHISGGMR